MKLFLHIILLLVFTCGCATSPGNKPDTLAPPLEDVNSLDESVFDEFEDELSGEQVTISDPLEPLNHVMFNFNDALYFWIAKPVMHGYKGLVCKPVRIGIRNFFDNISTPASFVNCLLQGKCSASERELHRFVINTTVGVLGFGDPAKDRWNIEPAEEDLGQTLAVYGLGNGFYVVWPVLGPSTCRDSAGMFGDAFLNPVRYVKPSEVSIGISAVNITNDGSFHIGEYESFKSASVDPYIAMREAYIQYRSNKAKE